LGDRLRVDFGIRPCWPLTNYPRAGLTRLGNFDSPPVGQKGQRWLKVPLGTNHRQTIKDLAIRNGLAG
jgi:hypothetical protein